MAFTNPKEDLINCFTMQLSELEVLTAMYPNPERPSVFRGRSILPVHRRLDSLRVAIEGLNEKAISNSGPSSRIYEQRKKEKEDRRNEHVECRDRRDILERRQHRKRIPRNRSPRDVTNDDQSTRAHDDPSNKADTSKKSHNKRLQLEATRRLQELELREIRAAKALAKTDRALGQLYDDEECLDTCHETVEIPTDRSRTTFESQTADETAGIRERGQTDVRAQTAKRKI
ncbi:hypothetical protein EVAR_57920_1 [Eumeta japonica]|uniref:Uncharacterized protein n=1 Tax=Eumeta variegata TaxID=151549 RepID=A0A4C1ZUS4_EUMVA|nr:hypothetical protein EVAR_57920_1 [Eumeta japonica]